jgi:hypothetical protein
VAPGYTFAARAGGSRFESAAPHFEGEAKLARRAGGWPSLDLTYSYGERGVSLHSAPARRAGISGHELLVSGYRGFSAGRGLWFQLRGGSLSDDNRYAACDVSYKFRTTRRASAMLVAGASHFARRSDFYYAPWNEWLVGAAGEMRLARSAKSEARLHAACGRAGNAGNQGVSLALRGTASRLLGRGLDGVAHFEYEQSIQHSTYIARQMRLELRWRP